MKVALINNMNNNFFSLARYLRDKGIDAHVFQVDTLDSHFLPSCDTFDNLSEISYLHQVANVSFRDFYKLPLSIRTRKQLKSLKVNLLNFDVVIACGGLAILEWAGINVDIFIPYGGDLYQSPFMHDYCIKKSFPYSVMMNYYIKYQRRAIAKSRAIIALASIDRHLYDALIKLNHKWIDLAIPMIYPLPAIDTGKWAFLKNYDFIVFSHARQGWKTALDYKGNDRAIRAFARFIKDQKYYAHPVLVLFEYGPDVAASKDLINELNIQSYVRWMPTMERKYIYEGLKFAYLVFDFFHDEVVSFGGVTFEAFSCSIPVIGNTKLRNTTVVNDIPLVHAYTEDEIYNIFMDYYQNKDKYISQGVKGKEWFDANVGVGLVDKYIYLIKHLAMNKSIRMADSSFNLSVINAKIGPESIQ